MMIAILWEKNHYRIKLAKIYIKENLKIQRKNVHLQVSYYLIYILYIMYYDKFKLGLYSNLSFIVYIFNSFKIYYYCLLDNH